ncbi:MAG: glycoside hydrolase family 3 N-terminal domain-containing protein [Gaiellaceae bacterium]
MLGALLAAAALIGITPQQKAALVVVSGLPAAPGAGGVLVQRGTAGEPRPPGALVFADQEGGEVRSLRDLPPARSAREVRNAREAYASGRATGRALRQAGVDVDLAPVLDLPDGPLGSRQFRSPLYGVAFARGLTDGGAGACVKHFPGLGPLPVSTDARLYDRGVLRDADVAPYRDAVEAGIRCVMVGHGIYRGLGTRRAALEPAAYALLRSLGFEGVAITDSLGILGSDLAPLWAVQAVRAGADLVLFTNGNDATRAIRALVPLARSGELDAHLQRVIRFRAALRR